MAELGHHGDAVSRAYYAMHHAGKALVVLEREPPRTHRGLVHVLYESFEGKDLLETSELQALSEAQRLREISDYDPSFEPTLEDVETTIASAKQFVDAVERILES